MVRVLVGARNERSFSAARPRRRIHRRAPDERSVPSSQMIDGTPTYLGRPDAAGRFTDYPAWVDKLADDVTLEGSLQDGAVQGADAVRAIVVSIRSLYEHEVFNFTGPWGDDRFIEDYTAHVGGESIGCVVMVTMNAS